jgi:hypothetical protein
MGCCTSKKSSEKI